MSSTLSDPVQEALRRFATAPDMPTRTASLTLILAERAITKVAKEPQFSVGLSALGEVASSNPREMDRLSAVAQLIRVAQSNRTLQQRCHELVRPALDQALPPVTLLKDADERFYVSKACALSNARWVRDYAAVGI